MRSYLLAITLAATAAAQTPDRLQRAVDRSLNTPALHNVHCTTVGDRVILTGSVALLKDRLDAEAKLARLSGVASVDDRLRLTTARVDDTTLLATLAQQLRHSGVRVDVRAGIVRLSSAGTTTLAALDAIARTAKTPGVEGIINNLVLKADLEIPAGTYSISTLP